MFVFQGVPFVGAGVKRCLLWQDIMWKRGSCRCWTCLHSVLKSVRGDQSADVLVWVRRIHTCQVSPEAKHFVRTSQRRPRKLQMQEISPSGARGNGVASFGCYDTRCAPMLSVKMRGLHSHGCFWTRRATDWLIQLHSRTRCQRSQPKCINSACGFLLLKWPSAADSAIVL